MCDQRLTSRMLRISTSLPTKYVEKPAGRRACRNAAAVAAGAARFEAMGTKSFGSSAWLRCAQAIHMLANTICGQAGGGVARRVPHLEHRAESLSDQALGAGMRMLSTCLPT
ncbi:hypothetical protein C2U71_08540 [Burkholderia ubonensis]|nr:hypothetical protein C2U71_08540 [Burkholderia ubonensis]